MLLVFFLVGILSLLLLIAALFIFSVLEIEIRNFYKSSEKKEVVKPILIIRFYFLDKILWFKTKVDTEHPGKAWKQIEKKLDVPQIEKTILENEQNWKKFKENLQKLEIGLSKLDFKLEIGTEDAIITSGLVTLIASGISMILPHVADSKPENYHYEIIPNYTFKNLYKLALNCIINVKMVHIISVIYKQVKKRRVDKYERTSNTRVNDYCHE